MNSFGCMLLLEGLINIAKKIKASLSYYCSLFIYFRKHTKTGISTCFVNLKMKNHLTS